MTSSSFCTKRLRESRESEDEVMYSGSSTHETAENEEEIECLGSSLTRIAENKIELHEHVNSGDSSSDNEPYEYSDGDEDGHTSQGTLMI